MKYIHKLLILCIIISFTVIGCTSNGPKDIVNKYIEDNKSGKIEYVKEYALKLIYGKDVDKDKVSKAIDDGLDKYISNIKVHILSEEIDKDNAIVMAEVTSTDFIEEYFKLKNKYISDIVEGNSSYSNEEREIFNKSLINGSEGTRVKAITLTKEKGKWKLDEEDVAKAIFNIDIDTSFRLYLKTLSYGQDENVKPLSISQSKKYIDLVLGNSKKEIDRKYDKINGVETTIYRVDNHDIKVTCAYPYKTNKLNEFDRSKIVFIYFELDE